MRPLPFTLRFKMLIGSSMTSLTSSPLSRDSSFKLGPSRRKCQQQFPPTETYMLPSLPSKLQMHRTQKLSRHFGPPSNVSLPLTDGTFAANFEDTGRRWCEHLSSIEHGVDASYRDMLQKARYSRHLSDRIMPPLEPHCIVTWLDLEQQYLKLHSNNATGPDLIPPEVLKCCSPAVARAYTPLSFKV